VFELTKQPNSLNLLRWTKELPSASPSDPLGLSLRVSARLANELLYCITSITPRARYYSFFPWAFQDYNEREYGTHSDRGRVKGVVSRERAMVLGAVLHHEGPCEGGGLGGSDEASVLLKKGKRPSYNLSAWKHLKPPDGQFGAAYKGSLINLGLFKTDASTVSDEVDEETQELNEEAQAVEVRELSVTGKRLAEAYAKSIRHTHYVKENWTLRDKVDAKVLEEFGSVAGLCELSGKKAADREVLRNVFFSRYDEMKAPAQQRRRMSLLFILECVAHAHAAAFSLTNTSFGDICYFGALRLETKKKKRSAFVLDSRLGDIAQRWKIYYAHSFLAVALQSLLVACVRILREHRGGLADDALLPAFSPSGIRERFREIAGVDLTDDFFTLTPRATLAACGTSLPKQGTASLGYPNIDAPLSERALETLLVDSEANEVGCVAIAALLLYQVLLRHAALTAGAIQNWYRRQVYDPYADVSLIVVLDFLNAEFGSSWVDRPNRDILKRVIWRFVIRQHQTMSYERNFGGTAPLFQVDGTTVIGTSTDYTDPRSLNPRLSRALQILDDLGLIEDDGNVGYQLTDDGRAWRKGAVDWDAAS
jgi:hypothetical protein